MLHETFDISKTTAAQVNEITDKVNEKLGRKAVEVNHTKGTSIDIFFDGEIEYSYIDDVEIVFAYLYGMQRALGIA